MVMYTVFGKAMNTPNFASIFDFLERWGTSHKFVITLIAAMFGSSFTYISTQLVHADDFNSLKGDFYQYRAVDIAKEELYSTRRQIDQIKSVPESQRPQWMQDQLDRLQRQEKRQEEKISRLNS